MSSRVFVSPPVLRRTANRLESARIQMQQMLTALERVKRDLPSYWSGPYTSAYLARMTKRIKKQNAIFKTSRLFKNPCGTLRIRQSAPNAKFSKSFIKPEQLVLIEHKF